MYKTLDIDAKLSQKITNWSQEILSLTVNRFSSEVEEKDMPNIMVNALMRAAAIFAILGKGDSDQFPETMRKGIKFYMDHLEIQMREEDGQ
jgi:hypothetical protein